MTVKFLSETYQCIKIVKSDNSATLYLHDGGRVEFKGISDWSVFSILGGDWSAPEQTSEEKLEAEVAELKEALDLLLSGVTE